MAKKRSNTFWAVLIIAAIVGTSYFAGYAPVTNFINGIFGGFVQDPLAGADDVNFRVQVQESLGAYAAEDIIVNCYSMDGTLLGSATAATGIATFTGFTVKEGSHVLLQGRQAAVATADGYVTPATEFVVGQGDPADTVSATRVGTSSSILWVDNIHDSAEPHFNLTTAAGEQLSSWASTDNLTTGDTSITFTILMDDDECWYGAPDFTDMATGDTYIGGVWLVLTGGTYQYDFLQGSARHLYQWSEGSTQYYAFNFDVRLWQDSIRDGDLNSYTAQLVLSGGNDFDQGAETWTCDVFDMLKFDGSINSGDFVDGGALAPAAFTFYAD